MQKLNLKNITRGILLLTFDDHDIDGWNNAIPIFQKYNARSLFSFSGELNDAALDCMKRLSEAGHTLGLHTVHHADAPEYIAAHSADAYWADEITPQLNACISAGISVDSFAFPNNKFNDEALELLKPHFKHFRAGCYNPVIRASEPERAFIPVASLAGTKVFRGLGIGEYYHTQIEVIFEQLEKAAASNEAITYFSHGISAGAKHVNMPTDILIQLLEKAQSLSMEIAGLQEIPE